MLREALAFRAGPGCSLPPLPSLPSGRARGHCAGGLGVGRGEEHLSVKTKSPSLRVGSRLRLLLFWKRAPVRCCPVDEGVREGVREEQLQGPHQLCLPSSSPTRAPGWLAERQQGLGVRLKPPHSLCGPPCPAVQWGGRDALQQPRGCRGTELLSRQAWGGEGRGEEAERGARLLPSLHSHNRAADSPHLQGFYECKHVHAFKAGTLETRLNISPHSTSRR